MLKTSGKKYPAAILAVLAMLSFAAAEFNVIAGEALPEKVVLVAGQSKILATRNVKRVATGEPSVADVNVISENEIRVVAKSEGITTVEIWDAAGAVKTYDIVVSSSRTGEIIAKMEALINKDALRLMRFIPTDDGMVIMEGEYDTVDDMKQISQVSAIYGNFVINMLKPSKLLKDDMLFRISDAIGIDTVSVKTANKTIYLDGMVPTEEEKRRVEKIAELFADKVINVLKIGSNRMVQVDVQIYEVDADLTSDMNINLLSPAQLRTYTNFSYNLFERPSGGLFNSYFYINNILTAAIGQGKGKLIAKPKLVTVNGGKASFKSGGERGYHVLSSQGVPSIEWKMYGIEMEIEPLIVEREKDGNMQLHVKAVLSELDDLVTGVSIAATKTSGADVNVYMKPGQTLLIAGMLKNKKSKKISRFPILGYIPIIDIFFKSVKEEIIEKELLMLLTPTITVPGELSEFMQKLER